MQNYGELFAKVYNKRWAFFSNSVAPKIERLMMSKASGANLPKSLCDVCCGTGQFANYFLKNGFRVHGIDLSPHMIHHAITNNQEYITNGQATFRVDDAAKLTIAETVSYATCLFDAMNHLPSLDAISSCIKGVFDVLNENGLFVFDINTKQSLQRWTGVSIQEDTELFMLNRGIYELSMDRAYTQITGFIREEDGRYTRFSEVAYNLALEVDDMLRIIGDAGFKTAYGAGIDDLAAAAPDLGSVQRVFFVCQKN